MDDNARKAAAIYDQFGPDQRDMSRETFINRFVELADPKRALDDATAIARKRKIDRALIR